MKWLVLDVENASYELYSTQEQAEEAAEEVLNEYASHANAEGWPDGEKFIKVFKLHSETKKHSVRKKENCKNLNDNHCDDCEFDWGDFDEIRDYSMQKVKVTPGWEFEEIDDNTIKVIKNNRQGKIQAGAVVRNYEHQLIKHKSIAEHALFLLAKDIMQNS